MALQGILRAHLLITGRFIDKSHNAGLGQRPCRSSAFCAFGSCCVWSAPACRALSQMLQTTTSTLASNPRTILSPSW